MPQLETQAGQKKITISQSLFRIGQWLAKGPSFHQFRFRHIDQGFVRIYTSSKSLTTKGQLHCVYNRCFGGRQPDVYIPNDVIIKSANFI
jgi:hypothetical protein